MKKFLGLAPVLLFGVVGCASLNERIMESCGQYTTSSAYNRQFHDCRQSVTEAYKQEQASLRNTAILSTAVLGGGYMVWRGRR